MAHEINKIDIGKVDNISSLSSDYEKIPVAYREPIDFFLRLAKFSLQVNEKRKIKLKSFESFSWKNADFLLFAIAIGGDGATVTNMSVLVSFLNVKEKIASSAENFILFRDDTWKTSEKVAAFFRKLAYELEVLENNIYKISAMGQKKKLNLK